MSAFTKKLTWTALALAIVVISVFLPDGADRAESWLYMAAGVIFGSVWVTRPGDAKLPAAALLAFVIGCSGQWGNVSWPDVVTCSVPSGQAMRGVKGLAKSEAANGSGFSDAGKEQLANLAMQWGAETVQCALKSVLSQMTAVSMQSGDRMPLDPSKAEEVSALEEMLEATGPPEVVDARR